MYFQYISSYSFCFLILHKINLNNIVFYNIKKYIKNFYSPFEFKKIESNLYSKNMEKINSLNPTDPVWPSDIGFDGKSKQEIIHLYHEV